MNIAALTEGVDQPGFKLQPCDLHRSAAKTRSDPCCAESSSNMNCPRLKRQFVEAVALRRGTLWAVVTAEDAIATIAKRNAQFDEPRYKRT